MKTIILITAILITIMQLAAASSASTQVKEINGVSNIPFELKAVIPIIEKQNEKDFANTWIGRPLAFSILWFQYIKEIPQAHAGGWFLIYRVWGGVWNGKKYGEYAAVLIDSSGNRISRVPPIGEKKFRYDTGCTSGFAIQSSASSLSAIMIYPGTKWDSDVIVIVSLDQNEKVQFAFSGSDDNPMSVNVHPVDEALRVVWEGNIYFKDFDGDGLMEILVNRHTETQKSAQLFKYNPSTNTYDDVTAIEQALLSKYISECESDSSIPSVKL